MQPWPQHDDAHHCLVRHSTAAGHGDRDSSEGEAGMTHNRHFGLRSRLVRPYQPELKEFAERKSAPGAPGSTSARALLGELDVMGI
jgi:hypothetical protein